MAKTAATNPTSSIDLEVAIALAAPVAGVFPVCAETGASVVSADDPVADAMIEGVGAANAADLAMADENELD